MAMNNWAQGVVNAYREEAMKKNPNIKNAISQKNTIEDKTNQNIEIPITNTFSPDNLYSKAEELMKKQWEREDAIRKEVQEREDSAITRATRDAQRAGINVNLTGIQPASSGGGITNATGMDYSAYVENLNAKKELLIQEIENNFKGNQSEKDRILSFIEEIIGDVAKIGASLV